MILAMRILTLTCLNKRTFLYNFIDSGDPMVLYKKISFWLILLVVIIPAFFLYKATLRGLEVNGYLVKKKDLVISVTGTSTGTIKADKEVKLSAQRIGRIAKLNVEEGSQVAAGRQHCRARI